MTINAGILDPEHWLLDDKKCGGRILGELCHFVDLAITLLKHTKLKDVKCIARDRYYQDTGNYILNFEDGSNVNIDYRSDLAPSVPKEKIIVEVLEKNLLIIIGKILIMVHYLIYQQLKMEKGISNLYLFF